MLFFGRRCSAREPYAHANSLSLNGLLDQRGAGDEAKLRPMVDRAGRGGGRCEAMVSLGDSVSGGKVVPAARGGLTRGSFPGSWMYNKPITRRLS
jgi:hypothetical protein